MPADTPSVRGKNFCIPNFCTSVLTKFRVVFDCSAKFDDVSLNDELLHGPDIVTCFLGVLVFAELSMGHIYLSHPIAIYACPVPWDSHYIIIILIWKTIQLKLLNL